MYNYYTVLLFLGDAQNEEFIKAFDLLCQTFEFQNVEISCGGKVQIESSSGVTKSIVAKKLSLNMQNYGQFDNCIFRFMQQDVSGTGWSKRRDEKLFKTVADY